jgi:hypothetical protein
MDNFTNILGKILYGVENSASPESVPAGTCLYRYLSLRDEQAWEKLATTLRESRLFSSSPLSFNDPFDSNPIIVDNICNKTILDIIAHNSPGLEDINPSALDIIGAKASLSQSMRETIKSTRVEAKLISFSSRSNSPLLWAHYAEGHKGICLQFVKGNRPESIIHQSSKVRYSSERPVLPLSLVLDRRSAIQAGDELVGLRLQRQLTNLMYFHKSEDWSYESEVRILVPPAQEHDFCFDENELISLIVGPLVSESRLETLKDVVKKTRPTLSIYRARPSENSFSIEVDYSVNLNDLTNTM